MRRAPGALLVLILTTMGGCAGDSVTSPGGATASAPEAAAVPVVVPVATGVSALAVIDGFRVHPEPGDDGVLRIGSGQAVVVNAGDIASRPPAPQSYLVVNWGDGPNQRVGCGPCRLEHSYAPGRYVLEATADDLQPASGSSTSRSIRLTVEVTGRPVLRATISANPGRVGVTTGSTTLTWATQGADTVEVTGLGRVALSGSAVVDPQSTGINTYEVVARRSSDGETARGSVDVILSSLAFFRFVPAAIRAGQQTTLEFSLPPPGTTFVFIQTICASVPGLGTTLVQNGPPQPIPGGTAISYTSTVPDSCFASWSGQSGTIIRGETVSLTVR